MKKQPADFDEWELDPDPVWDEHQGHIVPKPFFLRWWKAIAEKRYGSGDYWLEAAHELRYVLKVADSRSGRVYYEPYGFDYDYTLARESLGLADNSPLIFKSSSADAMLYDRLWDWLLNGGNQNGN